MPPEAATQKAPHPMNGHLSVAPIPGDSIRIQVERESILGIGSGPREHVVRFGVVLEIGPLPDSVDQSEREAAMPYGPGDVVYYYEQAALDIRGSHFITIGAVLAWEDAP